jgi:hypothetical protein
MKISLRDPPRRFDADGTGRLVLSDAGSIELAADEQVTFVAPSGSEYDVVRKEWGYYATPSLNSRLPGRGLRPVLLRNRSGRFFVCLVESDRERRFADYLQSANLHVLGWLDDAATLERIASVLERE